MPFPLLFFSSKAVPIACEHRLSPLPRLDMPRLRGTGRVEARTKVLQDDVGIIRSHFLDILNPELVGILRQAGTFEFSAGSLENSVPRERRKIAFHA